jgi:hypothetical protein
MSKRHLTLCLQEQLQALEARPRLSAIPKWHADKDKRGRKSDKFMNSLGLQDQIREEAFIRAEFRLLRAADIRERG